MGVSLVKGKLFYQFCACADGSASLNKKQTLFHLKHLVLTVLSERNFPSWFILCKFQLHSCQLCHTHTHTVLKTLLPAVDVSILDSVPGHFMWYLWRPEFIVIVLCLMSFVTKIYSRQFDKVIDIFSVPYVALLVYVKGTWSYVALPFRFPTKISYAFFSFLCVLNSPLITPFVVWSP